MVGIIKRCGLSEIFIVHTVSSSEIHMYGYLETSKGKAMMAQLQHICTLLRNAEKMVQCRKYIPRVMTKAEYENKQFDGGGKGTSTQLPLEVETFFPKVDCESKGDDTDEKC